MMQTVFKSPQGFLNCEMMYITITSHEFTTMGNLVGKRDHRL